MAGELSVRVSAQLRNDTLKSSFQPEAIRVDQATAKVDGQVQTIGFAAHETLVFGDMTTPGFVGFANLDDTNFIEVGLDISGAFHGFAKLLPGETGIIPVAPGATIAAKADTADCDLWYWATSR